MKNGYNSDISKQFSETEERTVAMALQGLQRSQERLNNCIK